MMQSFVKVISLLVALLGLAMSLVVVVGLLLFLSFSGVSLPSLSQEEEESPIAVVEAPEVAALADPASLWKAPELASMDQEPNAEELHYGRELVANTA